MKIRACRHIHIYVCYGVVDVASVDEASVVSVEGVEVEVSVDGVEVETSVDGVDVETSDEGVDVEVSVDGVEVEVSVPPLPSVGLFPELF